MAVVSTGVPVGAVASVFGNKFTYVNLREGLSGLPQVVAIFATYDPAKTSVVANEPVRVFSDTEVGDKFGFGFPAHLAARQTLRKSGIVPVFIFPIEEAAAAVAGDGSILVVNAATGSGTISVYIAGVRIPVNITKGATDAEIATAITAAINADVNLPVTAVVDGVTAEQVDITSKYQGAIADDIGLNINLFETEKDATPASVTFTVTALTSGAGTPTVTGALNNFGDDWVTHIVNTFGVDTAVMAELALFNEDERWDTLVVKPFRSFYGTVDSFATQTALSDALKLDRTNAAIWSPDCYSLPLEMAALAVGQIAQRNQNDPALPYTGLTLDGLLPGPVTSMPDYIARNAAINLGTGTTILEDGILKLEDIAMHYHRTGEDPPAYRWAVDIAKLAQWAFSVEQLFTSDKWRGKILVDDTDVGVTNPNARKPLDATADIFQLADAFNAAAIITKPGTTKDNTISGIDGANPNRLNIRTLIVLSGATRIISLDTNFGFNFGALSEG